MRACAHLARCVWFLITGEDFEDHAATGLLQHVLKNFGVTPHLFSVHLFDDVTHVHQALLVNHTAVQDPSDHQLSALHTKRHALQEESRAIETREEAKMNVTIHSREWRRHHMKTDLTRCSLDTLRIPTILTASGGTGWLLRLGSRNSQGLGGGVS